MALNGRLEDMNLLEILQIVAFSKKTGTLEVRARREMGSILFRNGRLLCAFASTTAAAARELARKPMDPKSHSELEELVRTSLRQLLPLREGRFEFRLSRSLPVQWGGLDASSFLLGDGVDPQAILLSLAREIDEARRDTTRLLESVESVESVEPAASEAEITVLLVDDEPLVIQTVSRELHAAGLAVDGAVGTAEALERFAFHREEAHAPLVVVVDTGMPTSDGEGLDGGFEIVERLAALGGSVPVLLMTEGLPPSARERAMRLGVHKILSKPTLTKLDPEEYSSDLRSFARVLRQEIETVVRAARKAPRGPTDDPLLNHEAVFDFLNTLTNQLASPNPGITRTILRVASSYAERGVLFMVKQGRARGLAGVHRGRPTPRVCEEVGVIELELQRVQPFAEVVYSRKPVRIAGGPDDFIPGLDAGRSREQALLPLLHNHEVLAVLCCDNPVTGKALSKLTGLHLFLVQAGMALENASLHRRLRSMETRYSLEDQGPLTQQLAPIAREGR